MNMPTSFRRRSLLTGIGATALGAGLLRPLVARAQNGAPRRLLVVHYPCGTLPKQFFPATPGALTTLSPILSPFEPVKGDMVVLGDVTNPAEEDWGGDSHARGMISFMTGKRFNQLPGFGVKDGAADSQYIVGADRSIDQILAATSPLLKGTPKASIQLGGSRNLSASAGLPGQRCLSYTGPGSTGAIHPETRPDVALMNLFGAFMPAAANPGDDATARKLRAQNRGVLDLVAKDLARLEARVPVSQRARLGEHLNAITQLTRQIDAGTGMPTSGPSAACAKPALPPAAAASDDAQHAAVSRQMMQIIKAAFLCDITRVATFGFANGLSGINFKNVIPGFPISAGHHDLTHEGSGSDAAKAQVEKFYCGIVAELLIDLKNTPDGAGTSMLDNTLVVLFTEVNDGNGHGSTNMPIVMFGGKSLGLTGGRYVKLAGRYMNDVWTAVARAFGVQMATFGDAAFNKGPVTGLFS